VTIQSRIKTPSSAFKKMVKSSKRQQQLHDILGLRVIVTESVLPWNQPLTSTSTIDCDTEMSTLEAEEAEEADLLKPLDSTVATEDRVVDLDDYLFDDFSETYDEDEDIHKEYAVWRVHDVITQSLSDTDSSGNIKVSDALVMESDETLEASEGNTDSDTDSDPGVLTSSSSNDDSMSEWDEDVSRFKDYVTEPKPSGYQSLHMTLMHRQTGIRLEVQIRSQRMHLVAEYGSAAHRNYKALALPATTSAKWRTD